MDTILLISFKKEESFHFIWNSFTKFVRNILKTMQRKKGRYDLGSQGMKWISFEELSHFHSIWSSWGLNHSIIPVNKISIYFFGLS